jgi:hypothetical protein
MGTNTKLREAAARLNEVTDEILAKERDPEPWWVWRWDKTMAENMPVPYASVTRWRRGSVLTVYRYVTKTGGVQWWFYGPFNFALGFAHG